MGTTPRGSKHTTPDYSADVWELMSKNNELNTHQYIEGRQASVKSINVLVEGSKKLQDNVMAAFHNRYREFIRGGDMGEESALDGTDET